MTLVNKEMESLKEHFDHGFYEFMDKFATKEDLLEMKVALIRLMFLLFIGQVAVLGLIVLFVKMLAG